MRRRLTRFRETTPVKQENAHLFLRRFAKHIDQSDLVDVPRRFSPNIVFAYGNDRYLKVAKPGGRKDLLKEARILGHLAEQSLPFDLPVPTEIHPDGFYAVFTKVEGTPLDEDELRSWDAAKMRALGEMMGSFLSVLHQTSFSDSVLQTIPRNTSSFDGEIRRSEKRLQFLREHGVADADAWEEELKRLTGLVDRPVVAHCDFSVNHILINDDQTDRISVIDFADATFVDYTADFEVLPELREEGLDTEPLLDGMLDQYEATEDDTRRKIDFLDLIYRIRRRTKKLRRELR